MPQDLWATTTILAVPFLAQLAWPAPGPVNQEAIDDVAAGKIKEAKASWWGFEPEDSTKALQAAIDSGAEKVIVDNVGQPWIVDRIALASHQEVVFEEGVEVLAKRGAFKGKTDALFHAHLKENVTLRGYGATLRMRRADYAGPDYEKAEWRHVLDFRSCSHVRVYGLTLAESGGDGIYLGTAKDHLPNKHVHIKDVICDKNYRQGISVINAEDLLIENCILRDTAGTPPMAGIDFEPNVPEERLVHCVMRNCVTQGNAGNGYALYLPPLNAASRPVSLRFENCQSLGDHSSGVWIATGNAPDRAVQGTIEFVNCVFEGSREAGVVVANKPVEGCRLRFEKCSVLDGAAAQPTHAPILFLSGQGDSEPVGGIEFADCFVRDVLDRKPMKFVDMAGGMGLRAITGQLTLEKNGERSEVILTDQLIAEWMPAAALKPIPRFHMAGVTFQPVAEKAEGPEDALAFVRLRQAARWVLYVAQGEEVRFRVYHGQVGKYSGNPIPVIIISPSGQEVQRIDAPFQEETEVAFTTPETGLYRIAADPGLNYLQVTASSHPLLLSGEGEPVHFYATVGELFFWVPAGTTEFGVRVFGEGLGEAIKAALVDPTGKVVEEVDNAAQTHQFEVALPQPSPGEAWSLRLSRPSQLFLEDHSVDLRGIPPLLAVSRAALLKPE